MAARLKTARDYPRAFAWVRLVLEKEAAASLADEQDAEHETLREMAPDERPTDWSHRWGKMAERKVELEQYGWRDLEYPALRERIELYTRMWKNGS